MIGWRQFDSVQSEFREAGYAIATTAEAPVFRASWTPEFFAYPVLGTDLDGNVYYYSQTTRRRYIAHLSSRRMVMNLVAETVRVRRKQGWFDDRTDSPSRGSIYAVVSWRWMLR